MVTYKTIPLYFTLCRYLPFHGFASMMNHQQWKHYCSLYFFRKSTAGISSPSTNRFYKYPISIHFHHIPSNNNYELNLLFYPCYHIIFHEIIFPCMSSNTPLSSTQRYLRHILCLLFSMSRNQSGYWRLTLLMESTDKKSTLS